MVLTYLETNIDFYSHVECWLFWGK